MIKTEFDGTKIVDLNTPRAGASFAEEQMRMEFWLAKQIGEDLVRTYPGRQWHVDVDVRNETIVIMAPSLSKRCGWNLHINKDTVAQLLPRCRKAAGTILEMFGMSRSPRKSDPLETEFLKRNSRDDVVAPDAAVKPDGVNPVILDKNGWRVSH